jgi:hypothetical protein
MSSVADLSLASANSLLQYFCLSSGNWLVNNRAVFYTSATSGTKIHFDAACMFSYLHPKLPFLSGNALHFREGKQFYVYVPADLDQFG